MLFHSLSIDLCLGGISYDLCSSFSSHNHFSCTCFHTFLALILQSLLSWSLQPVLPGCLFNKFFCDALKRTSLLSIGNRPTPVYDVWWATRLIHSSHASHFFHAWKHCKIPFPDSKSIQYAGFSNSRSSYWCCILPCLRILWFCIFDVDTALVLGSMYPGRAKRECKYMGGTFRWILECVYCTSLFKVCNK